MTDGERPNLLLIMTDQQRGDCLGIDGHRCCRRRWNIHFFGALGHALPAGLLRVPHLHPGAADDHVRPGAGRMAWWATRRRGLGSVATLAGELAAPATSASWSASCTYGPAQRYGFDHMRLADGTRGANNDYLLWRNGPRPTLGHGARRFAQRLDGPPEAPGRDTDAHLLVRRPGHRLSHQARSLVRPSSSTLVHRSPPAVQRHRVLLRPLRPIASCPGRSVGDWAPEFDAPERGLDPEAAETGALGSASDERCSTAAGYYGAINYVDTQIGRLFSTCGTRALRQHLYPVHGRPWREAGRPQHVRASPGRWRHRPRSVPGAGARRLGYPPRRRVRRPWAYRT